MRWPVLTRTCPGLPCPRTSPAGQLFRKGRLCKRCSATSIHMGLAIIDDMRQFFSCILCQISVLRNSDVNVMSATTIVLPYLRSCPSRPACTQGAIGLLFCVRSTLAFPLLLKLGFPSSLVLRNKRMQHVSLGLTDPGRYGQNLVD